MVEVEDLWLEVRGVRTFARVQGSGSDLVLVPGLGFSHPYFGRLQTQLAQQHRVWAFDPPGFGYSGGSVRTISGYTDHLAAWMQATGLSAVPVFGHSLGGEVAIDLAARYPQLASGLVLCAPTGIPEHPNLLAQYLNLLRDLPGERWPFLLTAARTVLLGAPSRVLALALDQLEHPTGPKLHKVACPVLLLTGSADPVIQPQSVQVLQAALPKAHWIEIEGGTHALHDSHTPQVAKAVLEFCSSLTQAAPLPVEA